MMGDSRNNSADSRAPDHGPVPVENVIGEARVVVLPVARFRWVDVVDPQSVSVGMPAPRRTATGRGRAARPRVARGPRPSPSPARGAVQRAERARTPTRLRLTAPEPDRCPCPARPAVPRGPPSPRSSARPARSCAAPRAPGRCRRTLDRHGLGPVAGVDEAGRGACAGPLVVAACVLRPGDAKRLDGLTDSKLLTRRPRGRTTSR